MTEKLFFISDLKEKINSTRTTKNRFFKSDFLELSIDVLNKICSYNSDQSKQILN